MTKRKGAAALALALLALTACSPVLTEDERSACQAARDSAPKSADPYDVGQAYRACIDAEGAD